MMFENLPYNSKIEICKLFYADQYLKRFHNLKGNENMFLPQKIYFSWNNVTFECRAGDVYESKYNIIKWYENNIKIIRKHKLLSITKRETVI